MQPIPHRLLPVKRAIQATTTRRLVAAAVGLAVIGVTTMVFGRQIAGSEADAAPQATPSVQADTTGVTVGLVAPLSMVAGCSHADAPVAKQPPQTTVASDRAHRHCHVGIGFDDLVGRSCAGR